MATDNNNSCSNKNHNIKNKINHNDDNNNKKNNNHIVDVKIKTVMKIRRVMVIMISVAILAQGGCA